MVPLAAGLSARVIIFPYSWHTFFMHSLSRSLACFASVNCFRVCRFNLISNPLIHVLRMPCDSLFVALHTGCSFLGCLHSLNNSGTASL